MRYHKIVGCGSKDLGFWDKELDPTVGDVAGPNLCPVLEKSAIPPSCFVELQASRRVKDYSTYSFANPGDNNDACKVSSVF